MPYLRSALVFMLCGLMSAMAVPAWAGRGVALVIGNARYQHTKVLANPINDMTDIASTLQDLGFEVIQDKDQDKEGMERLLRKFAAALVDADKAIFFYSGHGLQVNGDNYLVPIDASGEDEALLETEMVRLDSVQRIMEFDPQRTNIMFFDACRRNPFPRGLAGKIGKRALNTGRGLAPIRLSDGGTLISFATAPDNEADDGSGRNSPFTGALVKQMRSSTDTVGNMLIDVRNDVRKETGGRQVPWETGSLNTRFYFRPQIDRQAALEPSAQPTRQPFTMIGPEPGGAAPAIVAAPPSDLPPAGGAPAVDTAGAAPTDAKTRRAMLGGLRLENTAASAECAAEPGGCGFEIKITNSAPTPVKGPFVIDDVVTAFGARFDDIALRQGGAPGRPTLWSCTASAPFTCTHPGPIGAGASLSLPLTIVPRVKEITATLDNCATLTAPAAKDGAHVKASAGKLDIEAKTTAACSVKSGCGQELVITNTSADPFEGEATAILLFTTHNGAIGTGLHNNATLAEPPAAPWICRKVGLPWRCVNRGMKLAPGATTTLQLKMKPDASAISARFFASSTGLESFDKDGGKTSDFIDTSALLSDAAAPTPVTDNTTSDNNAGAGPSVDKAQACASITFKPTQPQVSALPRLTVAKRALSEFCPLQGPCPFEITVANIGRATFKEPVTLDEAIKGAAGGASTVEGKSEAVIIAKTSGWTCAGASGRASCSHPEVLSLEPGQSISLTEDVLPRGWTKGNVMETCVTLRAGMGGLANASGQQACATVELDPFNLKVRQSGSDKCAPGETCHFTFTVFNDGPIPHNAPVTFSDSMGAGTPVLRILSIVPPLPCATQPVQIPFVCTTPTRFRLENGDSHVYEITARMPTDGPIVDSFRNCTAVRRPWDPAVAAAEAESSPTLAVLNMPLPEAPGETGCHEFKTGPAAPTCGGGMVLDVTNQCACPAGMAPSGSKCVPASVCPAGWNGAYPHCCRNGTVWSENRCVHATSCAAGLAWNGNRCAPAAVCPAGWNGAYPQCCPSSQFQNGKCRSAAAKSGSAVCGSDRPSGVYPNCCLAGASYQNGICRFTNSGPSKIAQSVLPPADVPTSIGDRTNFRSVQFCTTDLSKSSNKCQAGGSHSSGHTGGCNV